MSQNQTLDQIAFVVATFIIIIKAGGAGRVVSPANTIS